MVDKYPFLTLYQAYEEKKILFYYLGKEYRIPTTKMSIKDIFLFLKHVCDCFDIKDEQQAKY